VLKAMVVGGEVRFVKGLTAQRLRTLGVEVVEHAGAKGKNELVGSVKGCDLIIVMVDVCNHGLYASAKKRANEEGVTFVQTSKSWALMQRAVRAAVRSLGRNTANVEDKDKPEQEKGKIMPKIEQAKALTITPYNQVQRDVVEKVREATVLVLEEYPEHVLAPQGAHPDVHRLLGKIDHHGIDIDACIDEVITAVHAEWAAHSAALSRKDPRYARKRAIMDIREKFMVRWGKAYAEATKRAPGRRVMENITLPIFGGKALDGVLLRRVLSEIREKCGVPKRGEAHGGKRTEAEVTLAAIRDVLGADETVALPAVIKGIVEHRDSWCMAARSAQAERDRLAKERSVLSEQINDMATNNKTLREAVDSRTLRTLRILARPSETDSAMWAVVAACRGAKVPVPAKVAEYFDGKLPEKQPEAVVIRHEVLGVTEALITIPPRATHIVVDAVVDVEGDK
jgi:hypothetical protein